MNTPSSLVAAARRASRAAERSLSLFGSPSDKKAEATRKKKEERDDDDSDFPRPPGVLSMLGFGRATGFTRTAGLAFA